jgi:hypothetical protein
MMHKVQNVQVSDTTRGEHRIKAKHIKILLLTYRKLPDQGGLNW